jgi:putative DNA primase/helicase
MPDDHLPPGFDPLDEYDDWSGSIPMSEPNEQPDDAPVAEGVIPLGHDKGIFYYLSRASGQVVGLTAGAHTKNTLMGLASVPHYWERNPLFTGERGIKWDVAVDWLMSTCRDIGIYDPDRIRGRGAWIDAGRSVLHLGDRLICDGATASLALPDSRHVYQRALRLGTSASGPLPTREAHKLVTICKRLRWERGIDGMLLAGFLAVAPVCGGLAWRPSMWLTGGSGSGKSYIQQNIVRPALAGVALRVQSKTSEAGIRQMLGNDALPVIFDEAESEDEASARRMQGVMDLIRSASSDDGGVIAKGSSNQTGAVSYRIRSSFFLSSINLAIAHQADDSRITVVSLKPPAGNDADDATAFAMLNAEVQATLTPQFAAGLVARSVRLLPVIRANAETFAGAVALKLGTRRAGDQLGALLAGAYSLHSEREITPEAARAWIDRQEWQATDSSHADRDEQRLLMHLTQARVRVSTGNRAPIEITMGRLIAAAWGTEPGISTDEAETELRSRGFRTDAEGVSISNTHPAIRDLLKGQPWAASWQPALMRLPGAVKAAQGKALYFSPGATTKAVWLSRVLFGPQEGTG